MPSRTDSTPNLPELSRQAQVLAQAAELMKESVIITTAGENGRGHRILFANSAYLAMTGWAPHQVIGHSPKMLQGPLTDPEVLEQLRQDLLAGRDFEGRAINYRADGSTFQMEWYIRAIRDTDGQVTNYFGVQRDITKATEELNRQKGFRQAFEQMLDAVVIFSPSGQILLANHALLDWLGEPSLDSVVGLPIWRLRGRPSNPLDFHFVRGRLSDGVPWQREYTTTRGPRGSSGPRVIQASVSPIRNDGELIGFVAIARDVTERARLEQIAASLNLSENLGLMSSGLRHELGNPVNSLKSALTVLRSSPIEPEKTTLYFDAMAEQVERLEYLLDNLRSFSLFDKMSIEDVDLKVLFTHLDGLVRSDLEAKRVRLHLRSSSRLFARANPQALLHVLVNLISNAAAAIDHRTEGEIRISASTVRRRVQIVVADNGSGIAEADLERIFAPFFTSREGGTGLGLAIVRKLVTGMSGTVDVASRVGRGTTFTVTLDRVTTSK